MRLPITVRVADRARRSDILARIRRTIFPDILQWRAWVYASDAQDRDWNWLAIFADSIRYPRRFECYSLIVESDLHCLMRLDLRGKRLRGVRWLVIEYLATNPADRYDKAGIKYLGESMVAVATERSLEHNLKGRVWLESLPRAQEFYENLGFEQIKHQSKDGYKIYILDPDTAVQLLAAIKKRRDWKDAEEV